MYEIINPYKQPVVTLKQWVKERKELINWKEYWDKIGFNHIKEDSFESDWDFTEHPSKSMGQTESLTIPEILDKYGEFFTESEREELANLRKQKNAAIDELVLKGKCVIKMPNIK